MAQPVTFCTVADVVSILSYDAQARLATDPQIAVPLAKKGDGVTKTFDTPFILSTTIDATVAGVSTPATLSPGTGSDFGGGVFADQIVFASAPALGALITAKADLKAVNAAVILQNVIGGASKLKSGLARYDLTTLDPSVVESLSQMNVVLARWYLRARRNMSEYDPIIEEFKSVDRWITGVATGKISLPQKAVVAQGIAPAPPPVAANEPSVFEPPLGGLPGVPIF